MQSGRTEMNRRDAKSAEMKATDRVPKPITFQWQTIMWRGGSSLCTAIVEVVRKLRAILISRETDRIIAGQNHI
jgi:hypothetical protein